MPQDDVNELKRLLAQHDDELINRRVGVLEEDVKTLVFHYIREFAHRHAGTDDAFEKFNVTFSERMQRYRVPYP